MSDTQNPIGKLANPGLSDTARGLILAARDSMPVASHEAVDRALERLDDRLRIAIAGRLKAGKSTLLNAILGEDVAPTGTAEVTSIVTWYRAGATPRVRVVKRDGQVSGVPIARVDASLAGNNARLDPKDVQRIDVEWPAPALEKLTLVDTPGLASLSAGVSATSEAVLLPEDGPPDVDAVIYLLSHVHATDADALAAFRSRGGAGIGPLTTLGVLSRADEVGGGRMDALIAAERIAERQRQDPAVRALCLDVVPVAGLLAETARTLRQVEFDALVEFAALDRSVREDLLLSAHRFASGRSPGRLLSDPAVKSGLLSRFGLFGLRLGVVLIRDGYDTASSLSDELVRRSGLEQMLTSLEHNFAARADALKARHALSSVARLLALDESPLARSHEEAIRRELQQSHQFRETVLLSELRACDRPELTPSELAQAERILGGHGATTEQRLAVTTDGSDHLSDERAGAVASELIATWRAIENDPARDQRVNLVARAVVRSLEEILSHLPAPLSAAPEGSPSPN